jgi:hypothetical protein
MDLIIPDAEFGLVMNESYVILRFAPENGVMDRSPGYMYYCMLDSTKNSESYS